MRKAALPLLAVGVAFLLTGCAHQQATYSYAGGYYLGDCIYPDICGPGLYGTYFYYTPLFPSGPLSPERMRVDRAAAGRIPRVVGPRGSVQEHGFSGRSGSSSSTSSAAPAMEVRSAPAPAPAPPPVHTVGPRD